ncbi:unnamed protein product [Camellia sinensis]
MGSCVSENKNSQLVRSPIKKNTLNIEQIQPQSSSLTNVSTFGDLGSKEKFFDSQLWLESDSEDFFSINGDFTPCWGNTPIHQSSFIQTSQPGSTISELSPTDNVKKLADLFSKSFNENQVDEYQNLQESKTITSDQKPEGKHTIPINGSTQISEAISDFSNEMVRGRVHKSEKQKLSRSESCCLPSLARNLSFCERKKRLSPNSIGR